MIGLRVTDLFDLSRSLTGEYLSRFEYPWEALPGIRELVLEIGSRLSEDEFERRGESTWVARDAQVFDTAYLGEAVIVDRGAQVRHCAYLRGPAIVGKGAVAGNSAELKNSILFDGAEAPHYNYVGDSILGFHAHMGAGSITSNLKSDRSDVAVRYGEERVGTGLRKFGAMLGDGAEIGCNSVLNPGTVVGKGSRVYPLSSVRGFVPAGRIYKSADDIVPIRGA